MSVKSLLSALFGQFLPKTGGTLNPASSGYTEIGYSGKMGLTFRGGTANTLEGATLNLFNKAHAPSEEKGAFRLITAETAPGAYYSLLGLPDGRLQWNGKEVERVHSKGDNWIRYENGMQIIWGEQGTGANGGAPISLPVPFINNTYSVVVSVGHDNTLSGSYLLATYGPKSTTGVTIWVFRNAQLVQGAWFNIIAVGRWK